MSEREGMRYVSVVLENLEKLKSESRMDSLGGDIDIDKILSEVILGRTWKRNFPLIKESIKSLFRQILNLRFE